MGHDTIQESSRLLGYRGETAVNLQDLGFSRHGDAACLKGMMQHDVSLPSVLSSFLPFLDNLFHRTSYLLPTLLRNTSCYRCKSIANPKMEFTVMEYVMKPSGKPRRQYLAHRQSNYSTATSNMTDVKTSSRFCAAPCVWPPQIIQKTNLGYLEDSTFSHPPTLTPAPSPSDTSASKWPALSP